MMMKNGANTYNMGVSDAKAASQPEAIQEKYLKRMASSESRNAIVSRHNVTEPCVYAYENMPSHAARSKCVSTIWRDARYNSNDFSKDDFVMNRQRRDYLAQSPRIRHINENNDNLYRAARLRNAL